ncbi:hypothetical protein NX02_10580 [Sphingomonas sanxanigenens DSM 19645 = NX02]|uniref:histidine kinase n=2 Tax=Sphingomonas sanxanigenens TaxID=397260 RepID=W0ABZ5_9SPHN|nr:hypothetical protein NX02_10580 [Sphingomonas sanxanigenens DSM 19645 = NX02]
MTMLRWPSGLRSLSARLALLYALIFCISVAVLLALTHWAAIRRPMGLIEQDILTESSGAAGLYALDGQAAAIRMLHARATEIAERKAYHVLVAPSGEVLTTNLPSVPRRLIGWRRVEADIFSGGEEDDHMALMFGRRLPDGAVLAVGRDIEKIDDLRRGLARVAVSMLGMTVVLALIGGVLMSRAIGRRLESVSATARRVIGGDLSERIPLRGTGDDFDQLAETLNLMLARIELLVESVHRVSDSIAHELRTPLARLRANLEDLAVTHPAGTPAAEALLDQASQEAARLQSVFDALLRIARIEVGRHQRDDVAFDLAALLADAVEFYGPEAQDRDIALVTAIDTGLCIVADRDLIFQAVSNLLDNAIKYTPSGGTVQIRATRHGTTLHLVIEDNGSGVDPQYLPRLTERFFRAPNSGQSGTGLGLALVAAVARVHGSDLAFETSAAGFRVIWSLVDVAVGGDRPKA